MIINQAKRFEDTSNVVKTNQPTPRPTRNPPKPREGELLITFTTQHSLPHG
jgi:hypothetical protein